MGAAKDPEYEAWRVQDALERERCNRRYAEFQLALQGLTANARRLVRTMTDQYTDDLRMARICAPGFTLAFERNVVGSKAGELKKWRARVRTLMMMGELPELQAEQKEFRGRRNDELASKVLRWSIEALSQEAQGVLRAILRPPVNALNFSVLLWPGFPFSMFGQPSAATMLELEDWQRRLKHQVCFNTLDPLSRRTLDEVLQA